MGEEKLATYIANPRANPRANQQREIASFEKEEYFEPV